MIIDSHARLAPGADAVAQLLAAMDGAGVTRAVVSAGGVVTLDQLSAQIVEGGQVETDPDNDAVLRGCDRSDGRLVPFYFANPHRPAGAYGRQAHQFRGLELSPAVHGVRFDDPRTLALVELAAGAGHPVYTVCLARPGTRTADLVTLAQRFPTVTFIFGHCGHIAIDSHAIAQIAGQHNIVAETSGCFALVVGIALRRLGTDRVIFGTDYPLQGPGVELTKLASLDLTVATWQQVTSRNIRRILGEDTT
jgi:predicted TIM-barrel fold metal-dependent hydrolase